MSRTYRLLGPPGCGKTWELANKWIPRAVDLHGRERVVCCSLTRAAARELSARADLPPENVGTLHALCYRALGRPTIASTKLDEWNRDGAGDETMKLQAGGSGSLDDPWEASGPRGPSGVDFLSDVDVLRHRLVPTSDWPPHLRALWERWSLWMTTTGYRDFTALLEDVLEGDIPCPVTPSAFVLDEAQDCSALEIAVVRQWADDADTLVLAGDPLQAIYTWRGADFGAFLGAPVDDQDERELRQSYRLSRAVLDFARSLADRMHSKRIVDFVPRRSEDDAEVLGCVRRGPSLTHEPAQVLQEALCAASGGGGRVLVLATCGFLLRPFLGLLRDRGIPFGNPWRRSRGEWNPLSTTAKRLAAFLQPSDAAYGEWSRLWTWAELWSWVEHVKAPGLLRKKAKLAVQRRADGDDKHDHLTDADLGTVFEHAPLVEMLTALEGSLDDALGWHREHVLAAKAAPYDYPYRVVENHGVHAIHEDPKLCVGTIHSVKGGEGDVVFLCPDVSAAAARGWMAGPEGRDDVLRVLYVGATRARDELVLLQPSGVVTW